MFQFLAKLFRAKAPDQDKSSHIRPPSLVVALTQISCLVQMHREKDGYPQIMLLVNDPEAMASIIDTHMWGPFVDVTTAGDCQFARLAGVTIYWPLPGQVWQDA